VLAVGGGSATGPRLVELRYRPPGAGRHVALVGKGVTFDTGGIDLKRGAGMDGMKDDMAGAAAILAAITADDDLSLPPALTAEVLAAADRAGELACELPIIEDYRRFLDSEVADLLNATNEPGDSVQAAVFLREFVAGTPWVHLDIAGPATAKEARYYQPKGASGWGVRTLLAFLEGPR
jgi:leucyl aminopeptidase